MKNRRHGAAHKEAGPAAVTVTTYDAQETPICCPRCGSGELHHIGEWFAHCREPGGGHQTASLARWRCGACAGDFWLGAV